MSEMKQGGDDGDAPRCPPHPGFLRGLCIVCGVKEEDTEGGAPELAIGDDGEMMVMQRGGDEAAFAFAAAAALCPPHPGFVLGLCSLCGAKEEDAEGGGAPDLATMADEIEKKLMEQGKEEDAAGGSTSGLAAGHTYGALPPATRMIVMPPDPNSHLRTLLSERKLTLILDLDHTLLNATALNDFSAAEVQNGFTAITRDDLARGLFRLDGHGIPMLAKLRPFAQGFLKQASAMFEMHVYTLAGQAYARAAVSLLGPDYFEGRIVSRVESTRTSKKSLDVIPRAEVGAVVILDDTDIVWPEHKDNLILIDRYHYFASTCRNFDYNISSMAEQNRDEREHDGSLAVALQVLTRVHKDFFNLVIDRDDGYYPDVREVIKDVRREVLRGCTVAFSSEGTPVWTLAVRLGAVCKVDVDGTVTHVVAEDPGTAKAQWARDNNKFLVNQEWIKAASFQWCRPFEQDFPVLGGD
ncbi:hypothetical protein HU200_017088 [Digitaria exilis]|uniref:RNA polymerase II C-terminal domain phosphatase-like n=1 Tax=Digitaria exilis TaxID=1010633 RepID=A0A835F6U1_9POAL|nr:hypothetical protein HU200_017088 [Digitaria exilis]CAB3451356.1 unnamed protein product [Digitaria exilis]